MLEGLSQADGEGLFDRMGIPAGVHGGHRRFLTSKVGNAALPRGAGKSKYNECGRTDRTLEALGGLKLSLSYCSAHESPEVSYQLPKVKHFGDADVPIKM